MKWIILFFGLVLTAASDGSPERNSVEPPSDVQGLKLQRGACPLFWFSFNGRCYKYFGSRVTWGEAELQCVAENSNLVSIHSLEEHNFVNHLIQNFDPTRSLTWIGLTDIHKEGGWMWSDGTKYVFNYWSVGKPNNAQGIEHCGHTNYDSSFKWNDGPCSRAYSFVCASRLGCPQ